jgi:hypothetical protein
VTNADPAPRVRAPMALRNLAHSVTGGRKVTFRIYGEDPVVGYFSGYDDDYFYVLVPGDGVSFERKHVSRRFLTGFDISENSTYKNESCRAEMEPTIKGCRSHMTQHVLHRQDAPENRG